MTRTELELMGRIEAALEVVLDYGGVDGEHHKAWVIDQVVRRLVGDDTAYQEWVKHYEEDGNYRWEKGIAP